MAGQASSLGQLEAAEEPETRRNFRAWLFGQPTNQPNRLEPGSRQPPNFTVVKKELEVAKHDNGGEASPN